MCVKMVNNNHIYLECNQIANFSTAKVQVLLHWPNICIGHHYFTQVFQILVYYCHRLHCGFLPSPLCSPTARILASTISSHVLVHSASFTVDSESSTGTLSSFPSLHSLLTPTSSAWLCYGWKVWFPQNSYAEALNPNVTMKLGL